MTRTELIQNIRDKESFLCVGLDTDIQKIPDQFKKEADPIFAFNKMVIEATSDFAVAYKPNLAFYESLGPKGWESLQRTMEIIPKNIFTIADAKRGDIGNTAEMYAKTFFEWLNFDSVTLSPYMGKDSVTPFLKYEDKWAIVLGITSNPGAVDFQFQPIANSSDLLFEKVIKHAISWDNSDRIMFVAGATRGETLAKARKAAPNQFFLVPGVGAQGGSLEDVWQHCKNPDIGLLVNSSRGIIYAGDEKAVHSAAEKLRNEMKALM
ncbi:orotidine-5'-phosphate decarboxylase [Luteibaculum oceani]|uniref:Orotidine-5'-phosphate decarboxylase n=1 Tax=Luteibaculum oceani TaxID=1294296 RepID=A0A5C6V949_9FLAO|nr:orotidine-5'-phosphate decarboxylase [Luteibaculum oceani]TXC81637.1 orotidine-5'-phosphate decarboxylase [Luteibaculum oceani]